MDLQTWSLIVGAFAPLLIAVVQQPKWTSRTRALVMVISSVVLGVGTAYFDGSLGDGSDVTGTVVRVLVAAVAAYEGFWKNVGTTAAIEVATSPNSKVAEVPQTETVAVPTPPGEERGE